MPLIRGTKRQLILPRRRIIAGAAAAAIFAGLAQASTQGYLGLGSIPNLNNGVNFPAGATVFVCFVGSTDDALLTLPQLGGNNLTLIANNILTNTPNGQLYKVTLASACIDTLTFSNGTSYANYAAAAVYTTGLNTVGATFAYEDLTTPSGGQADPQFPTSALTVPSGGYGIAMVCSRVTAAGTTGLVWGTGGSSNISSAGGDNFAQAGTANGIGMAHTAVPGSWTPSVSPNANSWGFASAMIAMTVGP